MPNSSLPPSRGEVRWGVRRHEPRANHTAPQSPAPLPQPSSPPPPPYPRSPSSFLRRQEPKRTHPFPNSSLPPLRGEVRWGVRRCEPAHQSHRAPIARTAPPNRHPRAPIARTAPPPPYPRSPSSFLRRQEPKRTHLFPNSSLPPLRGEVRWGVRRREPRTNHTAPQSPAPLPSTAIPAPQSPAPLPPNRHTRAPFRHSCAGRNDETHPPHPQSPVRRQMHLHRQAALVQRRIERLVHVVQTEAVRD